MTRSLATVCALAAVALAAVLGAGTALAAGSAKAATPGPQLPPTFKGPIDPMHPYFDWLPPEEAAEKAAEEAEFEAWRARQAASPLTSGTIITGAIGVPFYYTTTPSHKQINNYYCGPASVQIIDDYWGNYATQATYAAHMGVTREGTNFTVVDDALRHYTGVDYRYHASMSGYDDVYENVRYGLQGKHRPLVCDVAIDGRVWDYYELKHAGHIIPIEAFDWRLKPLMIRLNDPYNEADYHQDGGQTFGHKTYPREQIAHGVMNSMRPDLIW
jgi:hypothetical protein